MAVAVVVAVVVVVLVVVEVVVVSCLYFEYFRLEDFFKWSTNAFGVGRILLLLFHWVGLHNCDPTARNESHWYSVTIQNATIFDLQVKNIDFRFSTNRVLQAYFCSKTLLLMVRCNVLWQFQAFWIVAAVILLYAKRMFSAQFLRMELSTVARLIYH